MHARFVVLLLAACAGREPRVESPRRDLAALPAPHLAPIATSALRAPGDLHARVGSRDQRDPIDAAIAWAGELGVHVDATSGDELVAWAERTHRLRASEEPAHPGDLLMFDGELIGVVIARDTRGVTEFVYLAGGVVRRGFVDAARPTLRRDRDGAIVNTYLRHGKRAARGTRYRAGQLLTNVIRTR